MQNLLEEDGQMVFDLIFNKQAYFYVCGDVKMADDVKKRLTKIVAEYGQMSDESANEYIKDLKVSFCFCKYCIHYLAKVSFTNL